MQTIGTQGAKTIALARPTVATSRQPVLRRKCDCGQHTSSGECEGCKKKRSEEKCSGDPLLQRATLNNDVVGRLPNVVGGAMQRRGNVIDAGVRSRLESSFRCDL